MAMNGTALAGMAGLSVCGIKLHAFMTELSRIVEAAEAQDTEKISLEYEPGGSRHVTFKAGCDSTKDRRWNRVHMFISRGRRAVGKADWSRILGQGIANLLNPKGHGADPRRKLGLDEKEFLDELLSDEKARARLKKAIADIERSSDHTHQCLVRKRACNATYNMIDEYRALFLVKQGRDAGGD
jgi:hypothetical protein